MQLKSQVPIYRDACFTELEICMKILFGILDTKGHIHDGEVYNQGAKKVVSDSPGLVDFAIRLVKSVFNLPYGQMMFFEEFE